jgi:segregation and condensation protein B
LEENPENNINGEPEREYDGVEENNISKELKSELKDSTNDRFGEDKEIGPLISPNLIEGKEEAMSLDRKSLNQQVREFHRNLIEASLYAAGSPLTIEEISTKLEFPKKEVEELVNELAFDYLERSTALVIAQIGERFQMQVKPEYTEEISKFTKGGAIAEKYLRTLTVIALKQPILKSTVVKIRGTGAYEHVKYLIDNGFLDAIKKGRTHELTTTDKYADMFGLPKDKTELKRAMITQLEIEEISSSETLDESELSNNVKDFDERKSISENEEQKNK